MKLTRYSHMAKSRLCPKHWSPIQWLIAEPRRYSHPNFYFENQGGILKAVGVVSSVLVLPLRNCDSTTSSHQATCNHNNFSDGSISCFILFIIIAFSIDVWCLSVQNWDTTSTFWWTTETIFSKGLVIEHTWVDVCDGLE